MIRLNGTVLYRDGSEATFVAGSASLAEWELYALRHGYPVGDDRPPLLSALVIAHSVLGIAEGFDVWRKTVDGVELEADGVPPTIEAS